MKMRIRKCLSCNIYTLKEVCPQCGKETIRPIPPNYSGKKELIKYRVEELKQELEKENG